MFSIDDYDYDLPESLIAQKPAGQRDRSRLLHLNRTSGARSHHRFADIVDLLSPRDLLVINDTAVIPARLYGKKASGGKIELLILNYPQQGSAAASGRICCDCLIRASKAPRPGAALDFGPELQAVVKDCRSGRCTVEFHAQAAFETILDRQGEVPLPPYIQRPAANSGTETAGQSDRDSYQTVYAAHKGAVAAPTAGLHFTQTLLDQLREKGIEIASITLHVSYGTFMPIRVTDIREHKMHSEAYSIPQPTAAAINRAKTEGRRIVAVGTTSVRTLETAADADGRVQAHAGDCELFIYPGYRFKAVDAIITNFHLPRSTLMMLVSAFAGRDNIFAAYRLAIRNRYRFFSYGDAMMIDDRDFHSTLSRRADAHA